MSYKHDDNFYYVSVDSFLYVGSVSNENGNGAYVFCSEEIFAAEIERAREGMRYETEVLLSLRRAQSDVAEGRVTDISGLKKAIASRMVVNG